MMIRFIFLIVTSALTSVFAEDKGLTHFKKGELDTNDNALKAKAYYNMGNALFNAQRNEESLAFYRKALELNPNDNDAKYNYEMVRYQPEQQQEEQQNQDSNSEDENNQEKQDQKHESEKNNEEQQEDKQRGEDDQQQEENESESNKSNKEEKGNEEQSDQDTHPEQGESSEEEKEEIRNAEQILDALKEDEKILQKRQMSRVKSRKLEKDW